MELRHLRYFVAVAGEGHITRAAERLGIQQPPLSQQIRALENELGAGLFYRRSHGVELTAAGEAFLEDATRILADVDRAAVRARRTAIGELGQLTVGMTSSAGFHPLVPLVIRRFREQTPGVSLELSESGSDQLIDLLNDRALDGAFIRTSLPRDPDLLVHEFTREPMLLAVPEEHPLAKEDARPLKLQRLAKEHFILYRRATGAGLYDAIIAACNKAGFTPHIQQEAPWVGATLNLVAAGLGVSIVPQSLSHMHLEGIVFRRLDLRPKLEAPIWFICRRANQSPSLRILRTLVMAETGKS
ncbi:MAG: LysR family transcriptional regulator [Hyphomicrobiales bacterium]|nr:LysR family transcriptional regulator [Hyphomicrobiales bacterium]